MRLRFSIVENFIKDTLQILMLTAIVGCPLSGYHSEMKAMAMAASTADVNATTTTTLTPTAAAEATFALVAAVAEEETEAELYTPTFVTSYNLITNGTELAQPTLTEISLKDFDLRVELQSTQAQLSEDTNEIDSSDYTMTKHIIEHAAVTHFNKTQDLSSLSLLSLNETATKTQLNGNGADISAATAAGSGASNKMQYTGNGSATFQHIGSQKIALKSTTATTLNKSSNTGSSNIGGSNATASSKSITRNSAKKIESKYILPKPQKTDAPMLNYIFDTFSSANKHHHHDQRYGPHFEDVQRVGQPTNMTVQAGSSIHLNCRISLLQDKTVSWVRRNAQGENALDLLTVGLHTYTGDKRYKMEFQYPNNWRLKITNVKKDDEAMYECQISTHPPRVIQINLHVNAPKVMIVDEFGDPLQEKYYEIDSTLQLSCVVRNVAMATSVVYWKHGEDVLNYDVTRGGVSVKTELKDDGANSTLSIAKINKADSGNYTCSISDFQNFTIVVHILNGESFAELHHGGATQISATFFHTLAINLILLTLFLYLPAFVNR